MISLEKERLYASFKCFLKIYFFMGQQWEILGLCLKKECQVWTIKESYKLGVDIPSKVLAIVFGIVAEFERSLISSRTKEALTRVKATGKKLGRPKGTQKSMQKLEAEKEKLREMLSYGINKKQIAKTFNVSLSSVYRFLQIL